MADMASPTDASAGSKIFVGGLDRSVDEGVVRNFFQQFGPVVEVLVMRDPHNHQSRGFGFITFQRDDSANQVLQNRYHDMLGKRVEVKSAVPRGQAPPPQRGPPRSSQGYGYGQPRGGPAQGGGGNGYGYGGNYASPQNYAGSNNPWGMNSGFNDPSNPSVDQSARGGQTKAGYGLSKDLKVPLTTTKWVTPHPRTAGPSTLRQKVMCTTITARVELANGRGPWSLTSRCQTECGHDIIRARAKYIPYNKSAM